MLKCQGIKRQRDQKEKGRRGGLRGVGLDHCVQVSDVTCNQSKKKATNTSKNKKLK